MYFAPRVINGSPVQICTHPWKPPIGRYAELVSLHRGAGYTVNGVRERVAMEVPTYPQGASHIDHLTGFDALREVRERHAKVQPKLLFADSAEENGHCVGLVIHWNRRELPCATEEIAELLS